METMYIEQKFWSLWGRFEVLHADGSLDFTVQGEPSLTKKLLIFDPQGRQVGEIRQAFFSFLPKFELYENGQLIGEIHKDLSLFRPKYSISCGGWQAQGNLLGWDYKVTGPDGNLIGQIHQEIWHITDHYAITYADGTDALRLLMLVLAIDAVNQQEENARNAANNAAMNNTMNNN